MLLDGTLCTAARVLAGLSRDELAAEASLSVSVLARFERGETQPRLSTLRAIMDVLAAHGIEVITETQRYQGGLGLLKGKWHPSRGRRPREDAP